MNLYDIVARKDRMLDGQSGGVEAFSLKLPGGGQRAIRIPRGEPGLLLKNAHEAMVLRSFPTDPGWTVHADLWRELEVWLEAGLFRHRLFAGKGAVRLDWPTPVPMEFDLRLVAAKGELSVAVGPLFNPRARLLPELAGRGVEVGPGANPAVRPSPTCDVSYVERMSMEQWSDTYSKGKLDASAANNWDRYVIDSAHELGGFEDESIDFIFSSHVVEHLVNPLGVFANWWQKLAPGGVIAGVVPDARFTFDLRQPLSTATDFLAQAAAGGHEPSEEMYEKWCLYTAPYNTPKSLKARDYSIHVNYYSVESFRSLLDMFAADHDAAGMFMESVVNGKDFSFMIVKR